MCYLRVILMTRNLMRLFNVLFNGTLWQGLFNDNAILVEE